MALIRKRTTCVHVVVDKSGIIFLWGKWSLRDSLLSSQISPMCVRGSKQQFASFCCLVTPLSLHLFLGPVYPIQVEAIASGPFIHLDGEQSAGKGKSSGKERQAYKLLTRSPTINGTVETRLSVLMYVIRWVGGSNFILNLWNVDRSKHLFPCEY